MAGGEQTEIREFVEQFGCEPLYHGTMGIDSERAIQGIANRRAVRPRRVSPFWRWAGLVACAMICVLWWFSARWTVIAPVGDSWELGLWSSALRIQHFDSARGGAAYLHNTFVTPRRFMVYRGRDERQSDWQPMYYESGVPSVTRVLIVPIWMLLAVAIVPTGIWWQRELNAARRRRLVGHCLSCGYYRKGLNELAKCPECGNTPSASGTP